MKNRNLHEEAQLSATRALAAASSTPFWTAFKITLGIGLAQLMMAALFFGSLALIAVLLYVFVR